MTRALSLPGALLSLVLWTVLTVGGGIAQAGGESELAELAEQGIVYAIPAAALLLILLYRSNLASLGLTRVETLRPALLPSLVVALLLILSVLNGLPATSVLLILVVNSCAVGLSEELMFRGVIFGALRERLTLSRAVLLSALAFGSIHSLNALITGEIVGALLQSCIAVGMGLWAASLRLRTGSIYPSIVLHALWDLALLIVLAHGTTSGLSGAISLIAIIGALVLGIWGWKSAIRFAQASELAGERFVA